MQESQLAEIEKKRPALVKLRDSYRALADNKAFIDVIYDLAPSGNLAGDLRDMLQGHSKMYAQELATMDQIKANWEVNKAKIENRSPIALPHMVPPRHKN